MKKTGRRVLTEGDGYCDNREVGHAYEVLSEPYHYGVQQGDDYWYGRYRSLYCRQCGEVVEVLDTSV